MMDSELTVEEYVAESAGLDFKAGFDPSSPQSWCELLKDIVSIANSGGGRILVGVNDDGTPSGADVSPLLALDPALVTDKIQKYTGQQFDGFTIAKVQVGGEPVARIAVAGVRIPMVFTSPGTYDIGGGKQKTAFSKGTVYFRHGAKSEPATSEDLRAAIERELDRIKHSWLDGIAKVVTAPTGSTVRVLPPEVKLEDSPLSTPIRLTTDEDAPVFKAYQADRLYPYRQKEMVTRVNELLGGVIAAPHDIFCVRKVHAIDTNATFSYKSKWSPRQYSDAFAEWLADQYRANEEFFRLAREAYRGLG